MKKLKEEIESQIYLFWPNDVLQTRQEKYFSFGNKMTFGNTEEYSVSYPIVLFFITSAALRLWIQQK